MNNLIDRLNCMSPERRCYTLQTLPAHLADARQGERLQCVLTDSNFLQAKMEAFGLSCMIEDYDLASIPNLLNSTAAQNLRLVQDAIRLSVHILAQQTAQLMGQLLGGFEPLREQAQQWRTTSRPWRYSLASNLLATGRGMAPNMGNTFVTHAPAPSHASFHEPSNMWDYASSMVGRTLANSVGAMVANQVVPSAL
ncbi:MAG: hypothetical protein ACPGWR_12255 [Ardenticatenaceae bacterium]